MNNPSPQQQIYNQMNDELCLQNVTSVAQGALSQILARVDKKITIDQFAKRNQPSFILHSQNQVINSNMALIYHVPDNSPSKHDAEPENIPMDSMMNVELVETPQPAHQNLEPTNPNEQRKIKVYKRESINSSKNGISSINSTRKQILKKFQRILIEQPNSQDYELDRLRQVKAHEEFLKLNQKITVRPKAECKLSKGQAVVFDYDGNFSKRKEATNRYVDNSIIKGNVNSEIEHRNESNRTKVSAGAQHAEVIQVQSSSRAHGKFKSSDTGAKQIKFSLDNHKEEILNSIEIKETGIKVTVDGQAAKIDPEIVQNHNKKNSTPAQHAHTVKMKRIELGSNQRLKTESLPDCNSRMTQIKTNQRISSRQKARSGMERSQYQPSVADKISVENCNLKKMIFEDENEAESKYKELPSHRSQKRRVKTNVEVDSAKNNIDLERLKIKERLMSLTREKDSLPRIISLHKRAEGQILREVRKKKFLF